MEHHIRPFTLSHQNFIRVFQQELLAPKKAIVFFKKDDGP